MLRGRTVVVGVSGGIAAYKACELTRWLKQEGASVVVVMTQAATEFVTPLTFETLSGNPVVRGLWGSQRTTFDLPPRAASRMRGRVEHVDLAEAADLIVIAPATADLMARLVHGEAPDALTAVALASRTPLVICPAMDVEMWRHSATRANVAALRARGAFIVGPESGALASGSNAIWGIIAYSLEPVTVMGDAGGPQVRGSSPRSRAETGKRRLSVKSRATLLPPQLCAVSQFPYAIAERREGGNGR